MKRISITSSVQRHCCSVGPPRGLATALPFYSTANTSTNTIHAFGSPMPLSPFFYLQKRNFVDEMRVLVQAGKGGDGCASFHRDKGVPHGPPDGGSGGVGGSIYLVGSQEESSLRHLQPVYKAVSGSAGQGQHKHGLVAKPLYITVPLGTTVHRSVDIDTSADTSNGGTPWPPPEAPPFEKLTEDQLDSLLSTYMRLSGSYYPQADRQKLIYDKLRSRLLEERARLAQEWTTLDILKEGEPILVAKGGPGGRGNTFFASREIPGPRFSERGLPGDLFTLSLQLKLISDIGLIGLPNAGKSSFICAVTNAKSKIAAYPFTTLQPYIATMDFSDSVQIKVVDIPGLVRGAHKGVGLGRSFLKHLERTRVLAFVIDVSSASPWDDLALLRSELGNYQPSMLKRPQIVIANKADIVPVARENFEKLKERAGCEVVPVSAKYMKNLGEIARKLREMVEVENRKLVVSGV